MVTSCRIECNYKGSRSNYIQSVFTPPRGGARGGLGGYVLMCAPASRTTYALALSLLAIIEEGKGRGTQCLVS